MQNEGVAFRTRSRVRGAPLAGRGNLSNNTSRSTRVLPDASVQARSRRTSRVLDSPRSRSPSTSRASKDGDEASSSQGISNANRTQSHLSEDRIDDNGDAELISPRSLGRLRRGPPPRNPSPEPASSSDSDVVIVEVRRREVEEVVLSEPPAKRLRSALDTRLPGPQRGESTANGEGISGDELGEEEELRIVGETGQVVTRDLPHPRPHCAAHRFNASGAASNRTYCAQCFCYVCDVKAWECEFWGTGRRERDHANARSHPYWNNLRRAARDGDKALVRREFRDNGPLRLPSTPVQLLQQLPRHPTPTAPRHDAWRRMMAGDPFASELEREADVFLAALAMALAGGANHQGAQGQLAGNAPAAGGYNAGSAAVAAAAAAASHLGAGDGGSVGTSRIGRRQEGAAPSQPPGGQSQVLLPFQLPRVAQQQHPVLQMSFALPPFVQPATQEPASQRWAPNQYQQQPHAAYPNPQLGYPPPPFHYQPAAAMQAPMQAQAPQQQQRQRQGQQQPQMLMQVPYNMPLGLPQPQLQGQQLYVFAALPQRPAGQPM
ncbi:hypothetical protein Agub_g1113 [Astrephomene gubernaculifera]|uniref:Uncharacterized protein n=1 Tax=Astrephomene gubernaculifera TaxID=47775 RepID=A0AAD3DEY5_9CHLO|nr:hypothetical protein Agub_g1113 [Astrephomene gubernaculifera]